MARSLSGIDLESRFFAKSQAARVRYLRAPERLVGKVLVGWFPTVPRPVVLEDFARCRLHVNRVASLDERGGANSRTLVVGVNLDDDRPLSAYLVRVRDWRVKEVRNAFKD